MRYLFRHFKSHCRARRISVELLTLVLSLVLLAAWSTSMGQEPNPGYVPGEVLVGVKAEMDDDGEPDRLAGIGSVIAYNPEMHHYHLRTVAGLSVEDAVKELNGMPETAYAEPNWYIVAHLSPNDTYYANPLLTGMSSQYGPQLMQADLAWDIWSPRKQVIIAILDSGINSSHEDLVNKMLLDSSGNVIGYDAVANPMPSTTQSDPGDSNGHGSHCAGIAAAQSNNGHGHRRHRGLEGRERRFRHRLRETDASQDLCDKYDYWISPEFRRWDLLGYRPWRQRD